jgi:hypothetical protein
MVAPGTGGIGAGIRLASGLPPYFGSSSFSQPSRLIPASTF